MLVPTLNPTPDQQQHTEASLTGCGESAGPPLASHHAARVSEIEQEKAGTPGRTAGS